MQSCNKLFVEHGLCGHVARSDCFGIFDKVYKVGVFLFANGGFQGNGVLGNLLNFDNLFRSDAHVVGNFLWGGFTAQLLQKCALSANLAVDCFHHMYRDTNCARLVGNGTSDCLANPPSCVCGEFEALGVVELFYRFHKAYVTLLDQIQEEHTTTDVALGNANNQTKVCFAKFALCLFVAFQDEFGNFHFLVTCQKGHFTDIAKVHFYRVIDGNVANGLVQSGAVLVQCVHNCDAVCFQILVDFGILVGVKIEFFQFDFQLVKRYLG